MGELREYLRAYWKNGAASYSQGCAIMNIVVMGAGGLALLGLQPYVPVIPVWAAPVWLGGYVALSVLLIWPYRMWKEQKKRIAELEATKYCADLLDQIGDLREKIIGLRIDMEADRHSKIGVAEWEKTYHALEAEIADKIEKFASKAEAVNYRARGNITRRVWADMPQHQLYIDLCIHDIDYLRQFVIDYSRGKARNA